MFLFKEKLHITFYSFTWHLIKVITTLPALNSLTYV